MRRRLRRVGMVLGVLLGIVVLAVLAVVALPGVRTTLLSHVLARVDATLPGTLAVSRMSWPSLGRLELGEITWTDRDTTLAAVERVALDIDVGALAGRRVRVRRVELAVTDVDVPRILTRLPRSEPSEPVRGTKKKGSSSFLRDGAIPGVPAVAIDSLDVRVDRVVVSDTLVVTATHLTASADLIDAARVRVDAIGGQVRGPDVSILRGGFVVDLGAGTADGELVVKEGIGGTALALGFEPIGPDHFLMTLAAPGDRAAGDPGLALDVTLTREDDRLSGIGFGIEARTPATYALARHPLLADALASVPALEGLTVHGEATVRFAESIDTSIDLVLERNAWFEGGRLRAAVTGVHSELDTLGLSFPGVRLSSRAALDDDVLDARAHLEVRTLELAALMAPDPVPIDSVWADIDVTATGNIAAPRLDARAVAALRSGGFTLDRATVTAVSEGAGVEPIDVRVDVEAMDLVLDAAARVETGETLRVRLAPLALRMAADGGGKASLPRTYPGELVVAPGGDLTLSNLEVSGAFGVLTAGATLPASGPGEFRAAWRTDGLPRGLASLAGLADSVVVALDERLRAGGPYTIDARGTTAPEGVGVDARLRLPGPASVSTLLPEGADVAGLGPITGMATIRTTAGSGRTAVVTNVSGEGWLTALTAKLEAEGARTRIDTVAVILDGVTLVASGVLDSTASALDATLALTHVELLRRLLPSVPADMEASLSARLGVSGPMRAPVIRLDAKGGVKASTIDAPSIRAHGVVDGPALSLRLELPEGLVTPSLTLDDAVLGYATSGTGPRTGLPGRFSVDAAGPGLALAARASIDQTVAAGGSTVTTITTDTLDVVFDTYDAHAARPFSVRIAPERIEIDALRLEGGLGSLEAAGSLAAGASDLAATADLTLPAPPAALEVPDGLWPGSVDLTLRALGDSAHAALDIRGFDDGDRNVALRGTAHAAPSGVGVDIVMADGDSTLVSITGAVPVGVRVFPTQLTALGDSLVADVRIDGLTVPVRGSGSFFREDPRSAHVDGHATLRGTAASPRIDAALSVGFPTWPRMAAFVLSLTGGLDGDGISADMGLTTSADSLLTAHARVPAQVALYPSRFALDETRDMTARVNADALDLSKLAPLLPSDQSIGGTCTLVLTAEGSTTDPTITGRLQGQRLSASLADGSRVAAEMDVTVSGTARTPSARGSIEVTSGLIVVPEVPKDLHPVDGRAVLWETDLASAAANPDSTDGDDDGAGEDTGGTPPITPDLDVRVVIARGFWIRGQGLEIELAGDVRVKQSGVTPTVVGELEAVRGQLELLGRRLTVERGVVSFYGEDELDPVLDVTLTTRIDDTLIRVAVGGTATVPELTLSSEPEMTDGDIMSFLVLGRRLDELDDDQAGLLAERATDVAAQLGAAQVQAALGKRLGVDIISIQEGSGPNAEDALVVGKYLTDRILVKYEQALAEGSGFLVNLEYLLTQHLRVETLTGAERAGVEVNWTREY